MNKEQFEPEYGFLNQYIFTGQDIDTWKERFRKSFRLYKHFLIYSLDSDQRPEVDLSDGLGLYDSIIVATSRTVRSLISDLKNTMPVSSCAIVFEYNDSSLDLTSFHFVIKDKNETMSIVSDRYNGLIHRAYITHSPGYLRSGWLIDEVMPYEFVTDRIKDTGADEIELSADLIKDEYWVWENHLQLLHILMDVISKHSDELSYGGNIITNITEEMSTGELSGTSPFIQQSEGNIKWLKTITYYKDTDVIYKLPDTIKIDTDTFNGLGLLTKEQIICHQARKNRMTEMGKISYKHGITQIAPYQAARDLFYKYKDSFEKFIFSHITADISMSDYLKIKPICPGYDPKHGTVYRYSPRKTGQKLTELVRHVPTVCDCCKKAQPKIYFIINIPTWMHLCYMLGVDRSKLPYEFQNYYSVSYSPYFGNQIIDNLDPLHTHKVDPMYDVFPNMFSWSLGYCKRCHDIMLRKLNDYVEDKHLITDISFNEYNSIQQQN